MAVVAVDTSALMLPVELEIRVFDELERLLGDVEAVVPAQVVDELERLRSDGGTTGRAARVGLELLEASCTVVDGEAPTVDDAVIALALEGPAGYVVTADRELAARARSAGVPAITPRGRRRLSVQPP